VSQLKSIDANLRNEILIFISTKN